MVFDYGLCNYSGPVLSVLVLSPQDSSGSNIARDKSDIDTTIQTKWNAFRFLKVSHSSCVDQLSLPAIKTKKILFRLGISNSVTAHITTLSGNGSRRLYVASNAIRQFVLATIFLFGHDKHAGYASKCSSAQHHL